MGVFEEGKGKAKEAIGDLTNEHDVQSREKELEQRAAESER
jgi:hypothetical protein